MPWPCVILPSYRPAVLESECYGRFKGCVVFGAGPPEKSPPKTEARGPVPGSLTGEWSEDSDI